MPGLAGATLRSGGQFAPMRRGISYDARKNQAETFQKGKVTLKLFNHVLKELGPGFLETGVWTRGDHLLSLIERYGEYIPTQCRSIQIEGQDIGPEDFVRVPWADKTVFLTVSAR